MLGTYDASLRDDVTASGYMDTQDFLVICGRDPIQKFG